MKNVRILCFVLLLLPATGAGAQLIEKVSDLLNGDSLNSAATVQVDSDSLQLTIARQELEAARLSEANLRMEIEQMRLASYAADSVKQARQRQRIDSLRAVTSGEPVAVEEDTLFYLFAKRGGILLCNVLK